MSPSSLIAVEPFSAAQLAALDALMDQLIPASPDGRMPAARTLGLFKDVSTMRPADRDLIAKGLNDLDQRTLLSHGCLFAQLDGQALRSLAQALSSERSAFVQSFMAQTVGRYMAHPQVLPLIGLEARPPWPKGNIVAEGDWSLLQVVRQRPKNYRKV